MVAGQGYCILYTVFFVAREEAIISERAQRDASAEAGDERISRILLPEAAAAKVRDMIIEGKLAPGERVSEVQLGQRLGLSRTPVREALRTLAGEGLIELAPGRGAVVKKHSPEAVRDMLEALEILEASAARLACARASEEGVAEVLELHREMVERYHLGDRLAYFKLNQAIHSRIVALAGSPCLAELHSLVQGRIKRIRYVGNEGPDKWRQALAEHEEMVEALAARDGEALAEVLVRHLRHTWKRVHPFI